MENVVANLKQVHEQIQKYCAQAGRSFNEVKLLCVSKTKPDEMIIAAYQQGERHFGESYISEAVDKIARLKAAGFTDMVWHFIGPIQSNKTRHIAETFDVVESVDRVKILKRLNEQRPEQLPPLKVLLQVNISHEEQKQGCEPDELNGLLAAAADMKNIKVVGLMGVAHIDATPDELAREFGRLKALKEQLIASYPELTELSMGMTHDMDSAIAQGSTEVRIGSAIFGERDYSKMRAQ